MNRKRVIPIFTGVIIVILIIALIIIFIPPSSRAPIETRKAIILCSANDYYRKDDNPDFNNGEDSKFDNETVRWPSYVDFPNGYIVTDSNIPGHDSPGVVQFIAKANFSNAYVDMEYIYNWTNFFPLIKYAAYNLAAWVNISTNINFQPINPSKITPPGAGARIGLRWLNSSNHIVRTDWSAGLFGPFTGWRFLNVTGIANSSIPNEITQLHLVLVVQGNMTGTDMVLFDDVRVEHWSPPPIPIPPPSNKDTDGFPAQALQVYWVLKNHGYNDDNIFLMLYHKNDNVIDINATDGISNDLDDVVVDVEDDDVNASRFKQELDVSIPGSFASKIQPNDHLIIYMGDHGSNKVLGDGNATFHFEADDSYITELEFYNLVRFINIERMLINIDICFSGNFLNENSIGSSWYNITNSILITASSDNLAWSWRNNNNADGFAGSWFFHQFWNQLNQSQTIGSAFNFAKNYVPAGYVNSVLEIQNPLIHDNLGIKNSWSFTSDPPL